MLDAGERGGVPPPLKWPVRDVSVQKGNLWQIQVFEKEGFPSIPFLIIWKVREIWSLGNFNKRSFKRPPNIGDIFWILDAVYGWNIKVYC